MARTISWLIDTLESSKSLPCFFPWTQLEERSDDGDFKTCCWSNQILGKAPKNSPVDILSIWRSEHVGTLQRDMIDGRLPSSCPTTCPVIGWRSEYCKDSFYRYRGSEYAQFSSHFRRNRRKVLQALVDRREPNGTYPLRLKLHPSSICNLRCAMCNLDKTRRFQGTNQYYRDRLNTLMPYLEELKLFGGEPFACKETRSIIFGDSLTRHPQVHLSMITNGTMLHGSVLERLRHLRLGWFEVSLDSCTASTYHKARGLPQVPLPFQHFETFVALRDSGGLRIVKIFASFVIQGVNVHEVGDFVRYTKQLNVTPVFTVVHGSDELMPPLESLRENLLDGIAVAETVGSIDGRECLLHLLRQLPDGPG